MKTCLPIPLMVSIIKCRQSWGHCSEIGFAQHYCTVCLQSLKATRGSPSLHCEQWGFFNLLNPPTTTYIRFSCATNISSNSSGKSELPHSDSEVLSTHQGRAWTERASDQGWGQKSHRGRRRPENAILPTLFTTLSLKRRVPNTKRFLRVPR